MVELGHKSSQKNLCPIIYTPCMMWGSKEAQNYGKWTTSDLSNSRPKIWAIFCKQFQVVGLGNQSSHRIFYLLYILPTSLVGERRHRDCKNGQLTIGLIWGSQHKVQSFPEILGLVPSIQAVFRRTKTSRFSGPYWNGQSVVPFRREATRLRPPA